MFPPISQGMRELEFLSRLARATNRRTFLQWSGITIAVAATGCGDDEGGDITAPVGPVEPGQSTAEVPTTAPTAELLTVTVQARDANGHALTEGGADVSLAVSGTNTVDPTPGTDNNDGTYTVGYTPLESGVDQIAITINGAPISGSPFTVSVGEGQTVTELGSGDTGLLNYAFALEQLEAAFYAAVLAAPYAGISPDETAILTDIRDHEVIHREFLRAALGEDAIPDLTIDFASVDFTSRDTVLGTATALEDLGVAAYNGAGFLFDDTDFLTAAGKIVSVEARHAAVIRDINQPGTPAFAGDDIVDAVSGRETFRLPPDVLGQATAYITTPLGSSELPTT